MVHGELPGIRGTSLVAYTLKMQLEEIYNEQCCIECGKVWKQDDSFAVTFFIVIIFLRLIRMIVYYLYLIYNNACMTEFYYLDKDQSLYIIVEYSHIYLEKYMRFK